jgi:3-phytase
MVGRRRDIPQYDSIGHKLDHSMKKHLLLFLPLLFLISCGEEKRAVFKAGQALTPLVETVAVNSSGDAADDPAIWVHPGDKSKSLVFGTDKQEGIYAYGLEGKKKAFYPVGKINNIDIIYDFVLDGDTIDLLAGSNQTLNTIELYSIQQKNGLLKSVTAHAMFSEVDEVYGICTYTSMTHGTSYIFVGGKNGQIEQWELSQHPEGGISGVIIRNLQLSGKSEGMVSDPYTSSLFVAEEDRGLWKFQAEADGSNEASIIASIAENPELAADLEGVTLYTAQNGKGFIIVSSQGNNSYALFERQDPHTYLGSFHLADGSQVDGCEDTDGIAVCQESLGKKFPSGLFVAQDGYNKSPEGNMDMQNFKYVDWKAISDLLGTHGLMDTAFSVRFAQDSLTVQE